MSDKDWAHLEKKYGTCYPQLWEELDELNAEVRTLREENTKLAENTQFFEKLYGRFFDHAAKLAEALREQCGGGASFCANRGCSACGNSIAALSAYDAAVGAGLVNKPCPDCAEKEHDGV